MRKIDFKCTFFTLFSLEIFDMRVEKAAVCVASASIKQIDSAITFFKSRYSMSVSMGFMPFHIYAYSGV